VLGRLDDPQLLDDRAFLEQLDARLGQFPADQAREGAADKAGEDGEHQVQNPDVLVVGRQEPAGEEARLMVV